MKYSKKANSLIRAMDKVYGQAEGDISDEIDLISHRDVETTEKEYNLNSMAKKSGWKPLLLIRNSRSGFQPLFFVSKIHRILVLNQISGELKLE